MVFKQKKLKNLNGMRDPPPPWQMPLKSSIFLGTLPYFFSEFVSKESGGRCEKGVDIVLKTVFIWRKI